MKQAKFRAERCTYTFGGLGEETERPGKHMKELNTETYRFRDPDEEDYEDYEEEYEEDEEQGEEQEENQDEKQDKEQDEEVVSEEE